MQHYRQYHITTLTDNYYVDCQMAHYRCDQIWENWPCHAKPQNWVITTTWLPVLQRTDWYLKRSDQAFRCWDTAVNASSIHGTVNWHLKSWNYWTWVFPYPSVTCKVTPITGKNAILLWQLGGFLGHCSEDPPCLKVRASVFCPCKSDKDARLLNNSICRSVFCSSSKKDTFCWLK